MCVLLVGAGGVGSAAVAIAARRDFFERFVAADYDPDRARRAVASADQRSALDGRFVAATVDASSASQVAELCREHRITHVLNAVDPRFVLPVFEGAFAAGADYLDMAMSLSRPHPADPYRECGVKLGDDQFAAADRWAGAGRLALVGMGVEPGLSDVFARYAADELFATIDEIGVRDGADLTVDGYDFAPSFSIWTTIEECLNPPVVYESGRGWYTTEPFSQSEVFDFPAGIGPVECVNVEHEEVLLIPRWVYLYHVVDNAWSMAEYGHQAVVWQTAINPVVALELLSTGAWHGTGVLGPEALEPLPFLDMLVEYGSPWGLDNR